MSTIRRINILAGPGAGKSTLAARLFGDLRAKGYDIEYVNEYIKSWAYQGRKPQSFDQLYVFAKQLHHEEIALRNVKYIVTDSPLFLNMAFTKYYGCDYYPELLSLIKRFEKMYPSFNMFVNRSVDYVDKGRYQTIEQAHAFDALLMRLIHESGSECIKPPLNAITVENYSSILQMVEQQLNGV